MAGTTTGTMALDSALVIMDEVGTTEYNTRGGAASGGNS